MKKYKVNVNGTNYEIVLEVVNEEGSSVATAPTVAPTQAAPIPVNTAGSQKITSPMPGTIVGVNVKEGDTIQKGQVLMILEAMKMENEIMAPHNGKVISVHVSKGNTVETGALLCVIE